jgi:hypothetical protein
LQIKTQFKKKTYDICKYGDVFLFLQCCHFLQRAVAKTLFTFCYYQQQNSETLATVLYTCNKELGKYFFLAHSVVRVVTDFGRRGIID